MSVAELESRLEKTCFPRNRSKQKFEHRRNIQVNGEYKEVLFYIVQDERKRAEARDLLNGRYGWRGYGASHDLKSDIHHITFAAEIDEQIVGTMTLGIDSEAGLAIDHTFGDVVDQARRESGTRICELTKLAFEEDVRSKHVLAGLFHMALLYGTAHTDCTDLFIEVNPRHVRFYEMMLGFESVGPESTNESVGAPSRLMRIGVKAIHHNIRAKTEPKRFANARSLYPYFFPPEEERQARRLFDFGRPFRIEEVEAHGEHPVARMDDADVMTDGERSMRLMRSAA